MNWKGPIKPVYIDLPEDLHAKVRSEAPLRKTTARAAYQEAIERWLFPNTDRKDSDSEDKPTLTREEQALVDKLVALLRDPANPVAAPVKLMLEQYKPPKADKRDHEETREQGAEHRRKLRAG